MNVSRAFLKRIAHFAQDDSGTSTIEFVLLFPWFVWIMVMSVEAGMTSARNAMLERGLENAVRTLRINTEKPPNYEQLRKLVCQNAAVFPNCETRLQLEMVEIDPRVGVTVPKDVACNNDPEIIQPARGFANVGDNKLMMLRAFVLVQQMFVVNGIGLKLPEVKNGYFALVATSVFASEPT